MFETNDTFIEEAVKAKAKPSDAAKKGGMVAVTVILLLSVPVLGGVPGLVASGLLIASAIYTIVLMGYKNIEFEYDYTNGSLEIAKIINNEKRKKVLSIESSEVKLVAALGTNEALKFDNVKLKTYDCSTGNSEDKTYILVGHSEAKGNDFKVVFNPSEDLINAMYKYNRNEVYK